MEWVRLLRPDVQVLVMQAPGHGGRLTEPPKETVPAIVSEVIQHFPRVGEHKFAFYGHSLGAILALETARQLRREGRQLPSRLFIGGSRPPHLGPIHPLLHRLDELDFLNGIQTRYSGIPGEVMRDPELRALFLPGLRADFAAYETYTHQAEAPLPCPISAFAGSHDPIATEEVMAGWAGYTRAAFSLTRLAGDHFFLVQSRDVLIGNIRRDLTAHAR
jgi:medium-chain acyl-[acyl-carrier-protein] hydrolase